MIPVTKPFLPNREKLDEYIDGIYERNWLTNNGPLVQELTGRLEEYLGVENLLLISNGTLALQIAYRALDVSDGGPKHKPEAITTPFTFIATASSLAWDGVHPVFADIDPQTWCLDPQNIESLITHKTRAIVPVHVFGNACDVRGMESIAQKHGLKVIYDACHAFGVKIDGQSLLTYGDAATLSFHATKLFHTVEGGAIIFRRKEDHARASQLINFGISGPDTIGELGINAKMNEFQAAMGLCVLDEMSENIKARERVWGGYRRSLEPLLQLQRLADDLDYNYAYFPVVFESERQAKEVLRKLSCEGVSARRYFYPSLDSLPFFKSGNSMLFSETISKRIICLPMFGSLGFQDQKRVIDIVKGVV